MRSSVSTEAHGYGDVETAARRARAPLNSSAYYNADLPALPRTTNPDFGFTSFDTVPEAWLVVYRAITIEDWAVVMQMLRNGVPARVGRRFHAAARPRARMARRQPRPRRHV